MLTPTIYLDIAIAVTFHFGVFVPRLSGRRVVPIGAAGSVGRSLCRKAIFSMADNWRLHVGNSSRNGLEQGGYVYDRPTAFWF
jgi:hypothetical protein